MLHKMFAVTERSFLIMGTRAEDNFAQLDKISYPISNIEIVSYPTIFQQNVLVPIKKSLRKE